MNDAITDIVFLDDLIATALTEVAPDTTIEGIDAAAPLTEQLDLDSMDTLRFLEHLARLAGFEIPDRDAARLHTLDDLRAYLHRRGADHPT